MIVWQLHLEASGEEFSVETLDEAEEHYQSE